ncbi:hypothetical protein IWW42_002086 [Coemansia sp. RSA 1085]|nr:hypothetical protein IWW42_002086 [Coemansia sp. RSA 1085]
MADRTLAMSYKNFCGESLRPETAQTLDLWSELTIQQSQDSLTCPEDPSEVVHTPLRRLVRVKPLLLLLGLASALLTVYPAVVSAKSATYSVYGPASRLACSDDFGWEMWFPYGTAALFIGPVFLALQVAMCLSRNIYSTRTDITICMLVSQMALVLYTIWVAVLRQERVHLSEFFIIWLAMLATHISSVCWPLWCSIKRYNWMSIRPPPNGFGNPYGGTRPRRSLYTSLYQEFQMTLEDKAKRERFLQYATHCYRSELPSFLHDYQLLKYQVIDALRENQIHAHTPDPTVDAYLDKSRSKIQTVKEHPLADLIPITRGILESAMLLLPPLVVDESTQFPEAVKSSFSNFICTYLSSSSHMFISIPGEAVAEIHSAVEESYVPLSILDRAKDEVLFLLCTDVFSSYRKWLEAH